MIETNCENIRIWSHVLSEENSWDMGRGFMGFMGRELIIGESRYADLAEINQMIKNNTVVTVTGSVEERGFKLIWNCEKNNNSIIT